MSSLAEKNLFLILRALERFNAMTIESQYIGIVCKSNKVKFNSGGSHAFKVAV